MLPRSFYFLRHGETDWNKEHRLQGHIDTPLNDVGREQARAAIPALTKLPIDRIVCSTLSRAFETAQIINEILCKPIETDDRLREKSFGIFEGRTKEEIKIWEKENPDGYGPVEAMTGSKYIPQSEIYEDFHNRIIAVKNEMMHKYPDENILFISHGGVYRVLCRALNLEVNQSPNAQPFNFIRNAPMQWTLVSLT